MSGDMGEVITSSVEISGKLGRESVHIGGHMVPCTRADLTLDVGHLPTLTIALPIAHGLNIGLEHVRVLLDEKTQEALVALGWTPPGQEDGEHLAAEPE